MIQSFTPLFALILIKYFDWDSISNTICGLKILLLGNCSNISMEIEISDFGAVLVLLLAVIWIFSGLVAMWQFRDAQTAGFHDDGDHIVVKEELTESGVLFFMTFVFPLLLDDITTIKGFLIFIGVLLLVLTLMWKTNLYYQNPILTILGYKIYKIHFVREDNNIEEKEYIAVCRYELDVEKIVKWKNITDNVLFVYNKNA